MGYNRLRNRAEEQPGIEESDARRCIRRRFRAMAANFGKRFPAELELLWVNKLEKYAGDALDAILEQSLMGEKMPTLGAIMEVVHGRRDSAAFVPPPRLTPEQQKKSDHAAILSMLWLHYEKGWELKEFDGHVLGRLFGGNANTALLKAKEIYDAPTVNRWMQDQQMAGN